MLGKDRPGQRAVARIACVGVLAIVVRLLTLLRVDPVAFDSAVYFEIAQEIHTGKWGAALVYDYPPLFPALVAALQWLGASPEAAGLIIALAASLLVLLPLLAISLAAAGPAAAWGAAFLWAVHPYAVRLGVQALTDAPSTLFIAVAIWAGFRGLALQSANRDAQIPAEETGSLGWVAAAGAASGLAYLFRPEGIEPAVVLAAAFLFSRHDPRAGVHRDTATAEADRRPPAAARPPAPVPSVWRRGAWTLALLGGWAIVAGPYVTYISVEAGSITLSKKKSPAAMLRSIGAPLGVDAPGPLAGSGATGGGMPQRPAPAGAANTRGESTGTDPVGKGPEVGQVPGSRLARSLYLFQRPLVNGLHPVVIIFGVLGAVGLWRSGPPGGRPARRLLGALLVLHGLVLVGVAAASGPGYLGGHHFFPMVVYALPFAGAGLAEAIAWAGDRTRAPRLVPILALAAVLAATVPQSVLRRPGRGWALRPAAEWIRAQAPAGAVIVTDLAKLTYHAGAARVDLQGSYDDVLQRARARGAHFVVFYPDRVGRRSPDFLSKLNSADLTLAHAFPEPATSDPGRRLEVYRLTSR